MVSHLKSVLKLQEAGSVGFTGGGFGGSQPRRRTIPVLNIAHIHARGNGRMRTSEDYGELFDQVRETIGTKEFYCHFSGVEHRSGNANHYTQIKKSDLNFEPLAEFIVEDGGWLDITLISDSPLLEHDAMYMQQCIEKARHKQLEQKAREDRRKALALQTGVSAQELAIREAEQELLAAKQAENKEMNLKKNLHKQRNFLLKRKRRQKEKLEKSLLRKKRRMKKSRSKRMSSNLTRMTMTYSD